ncbi:hypothetical protein SASPL_108801 [Salvia splendens]|uniref:Uncharacterized protein n=1 Tax=Salvia splendens TaxID=180675 RepID=A0A8X8YFD7_SALSN|nr:hypothetical protein SASPL_108801 [Salvia splendens]
MVHSSEGKRALALELCYELDDKFVQHGLNSGAQSMVRIEELLQEDQNVKRRKERIQKQSSILSKLTTLIWQPLHPPILMKKVQSLLAHLPGRSGAAFDAAASGPNPSYVDSRSNGPSRRNTAEVLVYCEIRNIKEKLHSVSIVQVLILTMLEERGVDLDRLYEMEDKGIGAIIHCTPGRKIKWPKGEPKKLYSTVPIFEPHLYYFIQVDSDSWMHSEYFYTMSFQNLMLPEGKSQVVQDELSRLGEKIIHISEGTRALARKLCLELDDKFLQQAAASTYSNEESPTTAGPSSVEVWRSEFDAASNGPNTSHGDSRSNGPSRWVDLDRLYEMKEKDFGALTRYTPGRKLVKQYLGYFGMVQFVASVRPITIIVLKVNGKLVMLLYFLKLMNCYEPVKHHTRK